jgi:photosystem II stability/assembly factor-like uncharacterized protein
MEFFFGSPNVAAMVDAIILWMFLLALKQKLTYSVNGAKIQNIDDATITIRLHLFHKSPEKPLIAIDYKARIRYVCNTMNANKRGRGIRYITLLLSAVAFTVGCGLDVTYAQDFWRPTNGPKLGAIKCIAITSTGNVFVSIPSVTDTSGFFLRSTDHGNIWETIPSIFPVALLVDNEDRIYAGIAQGGPGEIYESSDDGLTWMGVAGMYTDYNISLDYSPHGNIYATSTSIGNGSLIRSTDVGKTWQDLNRNRFSSGLSIAVDDSEDVFTTTEFTDIVLSTNAGATWGYVRFDSMTYAYGVNALVYDPKGYIFAGADSGLYRTSDRGKTWIKYKGDFGKGTSFIARRNGDILATGSGVYLSSDLANSWQELTGGIPIGVKLTCVAINDSGYIYAGGTDGIVYKGTLSTTEVKEALCSSPLMLQFSQNYPNPFDASTMIEYTLPKTGDVGLNVYNALGEKVATLASGNATAGRHTVTFDGAELPNGIYYYRLTAGKYEQTGKMSIVH